MVLCCQRNTGLVKQSFEPNPLLLVVREHSLPSLAPISQCLSTTRSHLRCLGRTYVNEGLRFVTLSFHKVYLTVPSLFLRLPPYQRSAILLKLAGSPLTCALPRHESDGDRLAVSLGTVGTGNCSAQRTLAKRWSLTIRPTRRRLIKGWALTIRLVSLWSSLNTEY
jgi:hypothetical protein